MPAGAEVLKSFQVSELLARVSALISAQRQLRARLRTAAPPALPIGRAANAEQLFLARVHAGIDAHLDDSHFGVSELANALHLERSTLFKRLKALGQEAPVQLLRNYRLDAAATLLLNNVAQVTEVAYACGFESLPTLAASFANASAKPRANIVG